MKKEPRIGLFDVLVTYTAIPAVCINLFIFVIMLIEQTKTGWGFATNYEMLVLGFWFLQFFTLLPMIFGLIYIIVSSVKHNFHRLFILNTLLTAVSAILLGLSVLFVFC